MSIVFHQRCVLLSEYLSIWIASFAKKSPRTQPTTALHLSRSLIGIWERGRETGIGAAGRELSILTFKHICLMMLSNELTLSSSYQLFESCYTWVRLA